MALFIKKVRSNVTNLKWIGQQDLPDLAKALRLDPSPNQHGVAIKIGYDLNGKPVEEAFFGVYYLNKAGTQAVQAGHQAMAANQLVQTNWGFQALESFRAPAGTLDKRMPIYCLIAKSVQYDPQWTARYRAIEATLVQMFNQKLQQGWDQIRAADAISDQAVRNNEKFLDNIGRQEVAMRDSGGGGGSSGGGVDGLLRDEGAAVPRTISVISSAVSIRSTIPAREVPSSSTTRVATITSPTASATTAPTTIPMPHRKIRVKTAHGRA